MRIYQSISTKFHLKNTPISKDLNDMPLKVVLKLQHIEILRWQRKRQGLPYEQMHFLPVFLLRMMSQPVKYSDKHVRYRSSQETHISYRIQVH